jgi:hypothetical protein
MGDGHGTPTAASTPTGAALGLPFSAGSAGGGGPIGTAGLAGITAADFPGADGMVSI